MSQCSLHIKILVGWLFITLSMSLTQASLKAQSLDSSDVTPKALNSMNHFIDSLPHIESEKLLHNDSIKYPSILDTLKIFESEIQKRINTVSLPDSLLQKANPGLLISRDSVLSNLIQKYNDYALKYDLPKADISRFSTLQDNLDMPGMNLPVSPNSLPHQSTLNLPEIPDFPIDQELNKTSETLQSAESQIEQSKNLPEKAEQFAASTDEMQYFNEEKAKAFDLGKFNSEYSDKASEYSEKVVEYVDPEKLKKQLAEKKKVLANDALLSNMDKVKIPANDKLQKLKNKYKKFNSAQDVAAGKENPVKVQPGKRFVWGGNFQMNPGDPVSVDISPLIGYRLNTVWTIGTGGSVRYALDKKNDFRPPTKNNVVYGFRIFNQYKVIKSFFVHAEYEILSQPDVGARSWKSQAMAGIGKEFAIVKGFKGTVIVLYDFLHNESSPNMKPVTFRFGFVKK